MNKQIDQISDQVMSEFRDAFDSGEYIPDEFFERFAELIVAECARVAFQFSVENKRFHPDFNPQNMTVSHRLIYHSTCQAVGYEIKKHFGEDEGE